MMFSSRTAESFDPKPMVSLQTNVRHVRDEWCDTSYCLHDPRPHFEPTRDPMAWRVPSRSALEPAYRTSVPERDAVWTPRKALARPEPNPILVAFRGDMARYGLEESLAYDWPHTWMFSQDYTPEMVEHARRVLTLLQTLTDSRDDRSGSTLASGGPERKESL